MKDNRAIFTFDKTLDKGDKKATLVCFRGVRKYDELPAEYLRGRNCFFRGDVDGTSLGTICMVGYTGPYSSDLRYDGHSIPNCHRISQGDTINGRMLPDLIAFFKECGANLGEINRRQVTENKDWEGEQEVVI